MAKKKKKLRINEQPIRCLILANGPIKIKIVGTKKGKKGYNRKKKWDKE